MTDTITTVPMPWHAIAVAVIAILFICLEGKKWHPKAKTRFAPTRRNNGVNKTSLKPHRGD